MLQLLESICSTTRIQASPRDSSKIHRHFRFSYQRLCTSRRRQASSHTPPLGKWYGSTQDQAQAFISSFNSTVHQDAAAIKNIIFALKDTMCQAIHLSAKKVLQETLAPATKQLTAEALSSSRIEFEKFAGHTVRQQICNAKAAHDLASQLGWQTAQRSFPGPLLYTQLLQLAWGLQALLDKNNVT
eukprot:m.198078 g.198078  ORF g.198078 m.198078 type:complete len:186 (-) comp14913_c0_seq17:146-703(-)